MKASIRFRVSAVIVTVGFLLMLVGVSGGPLFGLLMAFSYMRRSELTRPVPRRELWLLFGLLAGSIALIFAVKYVVPRSASDVVERIFRHPAVLVPLWLLTLGALFRICQRQKGEVDA